MQLLIVSYYKAFRFERAFFISNGLGMAFMLALTALSYRVFGTVLSVAICTTVVLTIWTLVSEYYLIRKMNFAYEYKNLPVMLLMMLAFIFAGSFQSVFKFGLIYGLALVIYTVLNFRNIKNSVLLLFGASRKKV